MSTLTLSMVVKALDQASPILNVVGRNVRDLVGKLRMFNVAWNRGLPQLGAEVVRTARPAVAAFRGMNREAMGLLRTVSKIALAGVGAGYAFKRLFLDGATDAERFRLVLEGTEQSPGRADSALHWVREFKRRTGFELKEVQQAWVDFRREGLNPASGAFNRIADAAAAKGLGFGRVAGIWSEALDGNVKGLDALGITAEKVGDRIILKYDHLGQTIQKTVSANNKAAIAQALGFIINEKYAGFAERHAKTLPAMWSNAKQSFDDFALAVMNAGVYDKLKDVLGELTEGVTRAGKDGSLKRWADELSLALKVVIEVGRQAVHFLRVELPKLIVQIIAVRDWFGGWRPVLIAVAALLGVGLASAAVKVVFALGPLLKAIVMLITGGARIAVFMIPMLVTALASVSSFITATLIPAIFKLGAAFLATPVGWIVLALAAIAGAAYLLYAHWDEVWSFLDTKTGGVVQVLMAVLTPLWFVPMKIIREWEPLKAFFTGLWADITGAFDSAVAWIEKKWEQLMGLLRGVGKVFDALNPFGSGSGAPGAPGAPAGPPPAPVLGSGAGGLIGRMPPATVDGEIRVVVSADPGTDARLAGAHAGGDIAIEATTGRYGRFL